MNPYSRSDWNRSVSPMSFRWRKEYHACNPHFNDVRERLEPGHDLERCIRSKGAHSFSSSHTYEHSRKRSFHEERVAGNQNYLATKHGWKSTAAEREQAENAESNIDEDCLVVDVRKVDPRLSTKPCIPTPKDTPSHLCQYFLYSDMKGRRPKFDKNGRKTSDYVPSHNAIGSMIEKCLPHSTAKRFSHMFNSRMEKYVDSVSRSLPGKGTADTEFMCKTPVNIIRDTLNGCSNIPGNSDNCRFQGVEKVDLESRYSQLGMIERGHRTLDILLQPRKTVHSLSKDVQPQLMSFGEMEVIIMSVVVNRCHLPKEEQSRDGGLILPVVRNKEELTDDFDWRFLTVIAIVPAAGCFYSTYRRHEKTRELMALPLSWLRMKRNLVLSQDEEGKKGGVLPFLFASGSYVKSVARDQIYCLWMNMRGAMIADVERINCLQVPFGDNKRFLPDCYVKEDGTKEYVWNPTAKRERFERELDESKNIGKGRRKYIKGALYDKIPEDCLILDVKRDKDKIVNFDLMIGIQRRGKDKRKKKGQQRRNVSIQEESSVEIRYKDPTETDDLDDLKQLCKMATLLCKTQVRKSGDLGKMYAFGQKFDEYNRELNEFASNREMKGMKRARDGKGLLASTSEGVLKAAERSFPSVTRVLQDAESDAGITRCEIMGGPDTASFLSNSVFISEDLGNAVHQDINDECKCVCIWTETSRGWARNWYFIMPDVVVQYPFILEDGQVVMKTYQGIAVKLYDGIIISWDGRVIRHGTTVTRTNPPSKVIKTNHTYGCVYVAKNSVIQKWKREKETDESDGTYSSDDSNAKGQSKRRKHKKDS